MTDDIESQAISGEFVSIDGERFYAINNSDQMLPFFISVISDADHWMFVSSTGGLTAGRVSPEMALFPYVTVDRIHESTNHTGPKTIVKCRKQGKSLTWEPFNREHDGKYQLNRHIYKNTLGNKLCFEEHNHDLQLVFSYVWESSEEFGFRRSCRITNSGENNVKLEIVDGLLNILPAGTPRFTQTNSSNLVDAYKWTELDTQSGLAMFTLYSGITDRAEPCESLNANTVFSLGLDNHQILLSDQQLNLFRAGKPVETEPSKRGVRGAYLVKFDIDLGAEEDKKWQLVADLELGQSDVVALIDKVNSPQKLSQVLQKSIENGSDALARIMAASDGFQSINEENVSVHHYANVLFNVLRGGIFDDQYTVSKSDFSDTIATFNQGVFDKNSQFLSSLPASISIQSLLKKVEEQQDPQLTRLTLEYLPITFGRRHGDPSRPWNQFEIKLKDDDGSPLLSYQGNWRDIFQNWEALTFSYPEYVESVVAKFVNASTIDGYNPYRITKDGIDWEVEEPDDPWSYIGYWGDHQIIYLLKMLEQSQAFHPGKLNQWLTRDLFCYANVPYRIKPFEAMLENAKSTVTYDEALAVEIEKRVEAMGADGKMLMNAEGQVYQVNLLEKLLVPLLCKIGNFVVDGGIWLNAQRPEWNDANNALVGQGLSMVTLYYMRRYLCFLQDMLSEESGNVEISAEVAQWLTKTADALSDLTPALTEGSVDAAFRNRFLTEVGQASSDYRAKVYQQEGFSGKVMLQLESVRTLISDALIATDHSIKSNQDEQGLYHAYNLLGLENGSVNIDHLYPMLEGQVAALSSGKLSLDESVAVVESLFNSAVYRPDQNTFMLYPDRSQVSFLKKNIIDANALSGIPLIQEMLAKGDARIIVQDAKGTYRFNPALTNVGELDQAIKMADSYDKSLTDRAIEPLRQLYEKVFNHQAFTGRSGGMFGFEGLGCVYWHMVSKLLLAIAENYVGALQKSTNPQPLLALGELYYRVREGIGFNKSPLEYGAFPTDPYSHTPKHAGAQQPGMTGQVKEEILTRFMELGVFPADGAVRFNPSLLRQSEFVRQTQTFRYLDVYNQWRETTLDENQLAFTWCQVPIIYILDETGKEQIELNYTNGEFDIIGDLSLDKKHSQSLFSRDGKIREIRVFLTKQNLFNSQC